MSDSPRQRFIITRALWARSKRHPHLRLAVAVLLVVGVAVGVLGAVVGQQDGRAGESAQSLITASVAALAAAKDVSFTATGSGSLGAGPMVYTREGSNFEVTWSAPIIGKGELLLVNNVPYLAGNALYWHGSANVDSLVGHWWRWPATASRPTTLGTAATMKQLGIIAADCVRGPVSTVDGRKVVAVTFLYTTVYIPLRGNPAPVAIKVDDPTNLVRAVVQFSYHPAALTSPRSQVAPPAIRHYIDASTINGGFYESVGNLMSKLPTYLGS
jgi:hypothetical protein